MASPPRGRGTTRKPRRDQQGQHRDRQESEPTGVAAVSADGAGNRQPLPQERATLQGTTNAKGTTFADLPSSKTATGPPFRGHFWRRAACRRSTVTVGARLSMAGPCGPLGQFIAGCPQLLDPGRGPWGAAPRGTGPPRPLLSPPLWPKSSVAAPGALGPALLRLLTAPSSLGCVTSLPNRLGLGEVWISALATAAPARSSHTGLLRATVLVHPEANRVAQRLEPPEPSG